jgi:hypothetical protein
MVAWLGGVALQAQMLPEFTQDAIFSRKTAYLTIGGCNNIS